MKRIVILALVAAALVTTPTSEALARARRLSGPHISTRIHTPRLPRPHRPRSAYRSVRVRRADGTVLRGYRDSLGTHLTGPDGRRVDCQRQRLGGADVDIACR